jgi:hypothetical protein
MADDELKLLLTFLNASDQTVTCAYCSIPRLRYILDLHFTYHVNFFLVNRSLDLIPLSDRLKVWKAEPKSNIFIYHAKRPLPSQQQSLHRKVGTLYTISCF